MADDRVLWYPWPGPQTDFLRAAEFEVLFGGAKGPGKSDCLLMAATRQTDRPRYKGYILRETGPQLSELKDRSHRIFTRLQSKPSWNGDGHGRWTWPNGAKVIFESVGTVEDVQKIRGKEPSYIGHDEVGNVPDERVIDLCQAELRSPDKAIRPMWRGSANPGQAGHAWLKRRFVDKCGRDGAVVYERKIKTHLGEVTLTRRYVPAKVTDNPVYANDPLYMAQLHSLPDAIKRQLLYGDWDAGVGAALEELDENVHLVPPFRVPDHWHRFGAFDWGYDHPWVFGEFAVTEDGALYLLQTVKGRRERPDQIAQAILDNVDTKRLRYIVAGHDITHLKKAHGENTPTLQEQFLAKGISMRLASVDRVQGLQNFRHYVAWKGLLDGENGDPALRFFDTPNNRWGFDQLQSMIVNPDRVNDVLKIDADQVTGSGGDDFYDMVRYGIASRPPRPIGTFFNGDVSAFSKTTLAFEYEHRYRDKPMPHERTRAKQVMGGGNNPYAGL